MSELSHTVLRAEKLTNFLFDNCVIGVLETHVGVCPVSVRQAYDWCACTSYSVYTQCVVTSRARRYVWGRSDSRLTGAWGGILS